MGFFGGSGGGASASNMVGATSSVAGTAGLVPAPAAGKNTRYLSSDATFGEIPLLPQYKNTTASRYIREWRPVEAGSGSTPTIKVRSFYLIYAPAEGEVDVLSFRTSIAPSPAYGVNLALWNVNEDGTVGSYVIGGSQSTGTGSNTNVNISVTPTSINRGFYYISFTSDATGTTNSILGTPAANNSVYGLFLGNTDLNSNTYLLWHYTSTTYDQITHEIFSLGSPSGFGRTVPYFGLQYV